MYLCKKYNDLKRVQKETREGLLEKIFNVNSDTDFEEVAFNIFRYQSEYNKIYSSFLSKIRFQPHQINKVSDIPFLPIELFKSHHVVSFTDEPALVFKSSGTENSIRSSHLLLETKVYDECLLNNFNYFYGNPKQFKIIALLPGYLEQGNSSLIYMVHKLMEYSGQSELFFFKNNYTSLLNVLERSDDENILLIGVTYALLDFSKHYNLDLKNLTVMETGGMKGRHKEIVREELHHILMEKFKVVTIHSEYSMTELMSQAYSKGEGKFYVPPWMEIFIRDIQDPFTRVKEAIQGVINIIDLANIDSCAFIATQDLGIQYADKSFEVLGRADNSDIRGCNLLFS